MVRVVFWGMVGLALLLGAGCQQEMANQPRHETFEPSTFFPDGLSSRHLVPGTVARNEERAVTPASTGTEAGEALVTLPLPVTRQLLERGRERYNVYCSPCHDQVGTGQGMIVRRGYPRPPSFHIPRLRQAPVGHFFLVITDGYGTMPNYGYMLLPEDRWAVAAYIRALQLSQYAPVTELPVEVRRHLPE